MKTFSLIGPTGKPCTSLMPGTCAGHRGTRIYGRLDCRAARRAIANGGYVKHRVFFANEPTAIAAGYRPCAMCMPEQYATWKSTKKVMHEAF